MKRITIYYRSGGCQIICPSDAFDMNSIGSIKKLVFTVALNKTISYILADDGDEVKSIPIGGNF